MGQLGNIIYQFQTFYSITFNRLTVNSVEYHFAQKARELVFPRTKEMFSARVGENLEIR